MTLKQTVYFMTLVGALAGLCCWAIQSWIADLGLYAANAQAIHNIVVAVVMGALVGGLTVGFADRWTSDRVVVRWVVAGALLGAGAGAIAGLLYLPILSSVIQSDPERLGVWLGRPLTWLLAGGLIGLATGLRWFAVNRLRAVHALAGGLIGGALGGLVFTLLGRVDEILQALSYMITGMGITAGVTLAPVLLRDGVLQFISSADARAQNKYGSPQQEWVVQDGDRFVIGSQGAERNMTAYARTVDIYIPDAMIRRRHAILSASRKAFYLQPHPENIGPHGQPLAACLINNTSVAGTRELHDADEVILGQTLLRFTSKRKAPAPEPLPAGRRL
jgi:hypothetical protein